MGNRLFVGNLSYNTSEDELKTVFAQAGSVTSVRIILDRETGRSRGFAFVELKSDSEAAEAIETLDGLLVGGRALSVREAEDRPPRQNGGGTGGAYVSRPGPSIPHRPQSRPAYADSPPPELPPTGRKQGGKQKRDRDRRNRDQDWD